MTTQPGFSKSLPASTKTILRKFLTQLTSSGQRQTSFKNDVIAESRRDEKCKKLNSPTPVEKRSGLPIFPAHSKSRERTFDLLTLVPASPRSVMAPPPSPAVQASRKRSGQMKKICESFVEHNNNDVNDDDDVKADDFDADFSEAGIDFFFGERTVVQRNVRHVDNYDADDDVSSVGGDLDCDVFDDEQNDANDDDNDDSFYVDEIDSRLESFEEELKDDLRVTQSLGPQLSEAFDLVRVMDFEGPWMSNIDWMSSISVIEKSVDINFVVNDLSFEGQEEDEVRSSNLSSHLLKNNMLSWKTFLKNGPFPASFFFIFVFSTNS